MILNYNKSTVSLLAASILLCLALVAGCCGTSSELKPSPVTETTPVSTSSVGASTPVATTQTASSEIYGVGQSVAIGDYKVRVNSVRTQTSGEYWSPEPGYEWCIIDVTLENMGDKPLSVSSIVQFSLVDSDGRSQDQSLLASTNGNLDGEIGVGRKMTGEIAYEVKQAVTGLELQFKPSLYQTGQAIFKIN